MNVSVKENLRESKGDPGNVLLDVDMHEEKQIATEELQTTMERALQFARKISFSRDVNNRYE